MEAQVWEVKKFAGSPVLVRRELVMGGVGAAQVRSRVDVPVGRQANWEY